MVTFGTWGLNSTARWIASTAFISAVFKPRLEAVSGENLHMWRNTTIKFFINRETEAVQEMLRWPHHVKSTIETTKVETKSRVIISNIWSWYVVNVLILGTSNKIYKNVAGFNERKLVHLLSKERHGNYTDVQGNCIIMLLCTLDIWIL